MHEIRIKRSGPLNAARLHDDLSDAMGAAFRGVTASDEVVRVHLNRPVQPGDAAAVYGALNRHNPAEPSRSQQAERAARERLRQLRQQDTPLGAEELRALSPPVKRLARKLMRLEAELRRRGLLSDETPG